MPNTPVAVGKGMITWCKNSLVDDARTEEFKRLFSEAGTLDEIPEAMRQGYIEYVINTRDINSVEQMMDGQEIRRCATENNVNLFTALDTISVLLDVLEETTLTISTIDA